MKRRLFIAPLLLTLAGCPGSGDRLAHGMWRDITVLKETVCFSINKKDKLEYYYLSSNKDNKVTDILTNSDEHLTLSYPKTCLKANLEKGLQYYSKYTLNGVNYRYNFYIDNNWNVISLKGEL